MVAPAAWASRSTASTSAREETLYASVTPPQPPASVTQLPFASSARLHSATIIPPAWKHMTSPSGDSPLQPSDS